MRIEIESDWSDVNRELDRLERLPNGAAITLLDALLGASFSAVEANVHILTGRLKGTGTVHSWTLGPLWEGRIHYGTPGFFDVHHHHYGPEVMYAIFEKRRGGTHDFFNPAKAMESAFVEGMVAILRGDV